MKEVSYFNVLGERIRIKDSILRDKGITLLIGDSYGEGYTPNGYVKSWIEFVKEMRPGEYKSSAIGGAGFLAGVTFIQQLYNLYNGMSATERIRVRKIVVAGGFNDTSFESEQLANAVHIFGNTCRDLFPFVNEVYCCVIGWSDRADFRTGIYNNIMPAYNKGSSLGKMTYVANCAYELHDYRRMSSDNIHPNLSGYEALGRAICEVLECGNYHTIFGWRDLNANITYGTPSLSPLGASIVDDVATITWLPLDIVTNDITVSGGEWIEIGNFDTNILNGYNLNTPFCTLNATCYLLDTYEHYYTASAKIGIYAGKIYLMINEVQPNGSGWFRLDNTKKIMIDACTTSIASYLC